MHFSRWRVVRDSVGEAAANPAGQGDESVGQIRHQGLPLMHRWDHMESGHAAMRQFLRFQSLWNHADPFAAGSQSGGGESSPHASPSAAVNDANIALSQQRSKRFSRTGACGV